MIEPVNDNTPPKPAACPQCGKPRVTQYRPFCSKHCADVDLARWLGGRYAIPASPSRDDEDSAPDGPSNWPGGASPAR